MRWVLVAVVAASLVTVSGCMGETQGDAQGAEAPSSSASDTSAAGSPDTAVSSSATEPGATSSGPPAVDNRPPVAHASVLEAGMPLQATPDGFVSKPGQDLTFDATGSSDADGDRLLFAWAFGDGATATGEVAIHNFTEGSFIVSLLVEDGRGGTDRTELLVSLQRPAPPLYFYDGGEAPAAWTLTEGIVVNDNIANEAGEHVIDQDHPLAAGWHVTEATAFVGGKSWTLQDEAAGGYHDGEFTRMVTTQAINLSAEAPAVWTFWFIGSAEFNNFDGLYWGVTLDGADFIEYGSWSGEKPEWEIVYNDLTPHRGQAVQLWYLFKSDNSCSVDTTLPDNDVLSCGAGATTGYFVDEIVVRGA